MKRLLSVLCVASVSVLVAQTAQPQPAATVDLSGSRAESGATVRQESPGLHLSWPSGAGERGEIVFNLAEGRPLLERLAVIATSQGRETPAVLMQRVDPVTTMRIGSRDMTAPAG